MRIAPVLRMSKGPGNCPAPFDIWYSTRATTADPWLLPVNLGVAVNTTAFDGGPAISYDGTALYFFSNRPGGNRGNDLYVTTRARVR